MPLTIARSVAPKQQLAKSGVVVMKRCDMRSIMVLGRWRRAQGSKAREQGAVVAVAGPAGQPTCTLQGLAHLPPAGTLAQASRPRWQAPTPPGPTATSTPAPATHRYHHS